MAVLQTTRTTLPAWLSYFMLHTMPPIFTEGKDAPINKRQSMRSNSSVRMEYQATATALRYLTIDGSRKIPETGEGELSSFGLRHNHYHHDYHTLFVLPPSTMPPYYTCTFAATFAGSGPFTCFCSLRSAALMRLAIRSQ